MDRFSVEIHSVDGTRKDYYITLVYMRLVFFMMTFQLGFVSEFVSIMNEWEEVMNGQEIHYVNDFHKCL